MLCVRSSPISGERDSAAGFSLVEMLAAVVVAGAVGVMTASLTFSVVRWERDAVARVEAHQGLQAALHSVSEDLRLAGACLPELGRFLAIDAVDGGMLDELVVRVGRVQNDQFCVEETLREAVDEGDVVLPVGATGIAGFRRGMLVAVVHPDGESEIVAIDAVDAVANELTLGDPLSRDYPGATSAVYGLLERRYRVTGGVLELSVDRGTFEPFVSGMTRFNLRWILNRGCPTCDVVALPANDAEWHLVNEIVIAAAVRASAEGGDTLLTSDDIRVKPRNLVHLVR